MMASPNSRLRLQMVAAVAAVMLLTTVSHIHPHWKQGSYGYVVSGYERLRDWRLLDGHDQQQPQSSDAFNPDNGRRIGVKYDSEHGHRLNSSERDGVADDENGDAICANAPNMTGIQVIMKTGASEAMDKVPTQILTTLSCVDNFLIFSDMEQQIGHVHLIDTLADIDPDFMASNSDFDLYRAQQACPVSQKLCIEERIKGEGGVAWTLDKHKFIPMVAKTWELRPHQEWYVFIEADTYTLWGNLVDFVRRESGMDGYRDMVYFGSRVYVGDLPFPHGGSGYVISGAIMKKFMDRADRDDMVARWTKRVGHEFYGDAALAKAIRAETGVNGPLQAYPLVQGDGPNTLPYGKDGHNWCEPFFTMHHVDANDVSAIWKFEKSRNQKQQRLVLIKDVYHGLVGPEMTKQRDDWDNLSQDSCYTNPDRMDGDDDENQKKKKKVESWTPAEREAWTSPHQCAKVCEERESANELLRMDPDGEEAKKLSDDQRATMTAAKKGRSCFQWRWHDEQCCTAKHIRLGKPKQADVESEDDAKSRKSQWVSGWHLGAIKDWIAAMGECEFPAWKKLE